MSESLENSGRPVRVAVEGCGHGTLDAIYASIDEGCRIKGWDHGVDLVIIGGDFQAVRNQHDLNVTAMPHKYREMADFHQYYSGTKTAPYLTIFIGGNHEASNHLFELFYGGWVAPNIYYMGAANLLRFGPLRIAGLSGIWKPYDYRKPHFERLPYNQEEMTTIFHVRELDVRKLLAVRSQVSIGLSHDWPQGIEWFGDHDWLFKKRDDFKIDAESGKLGSVAARQCLDRLRPPHWFSAHLHTKYAAIMEHGDYEPVRHPANSRFSQDRRAPQSQKTPSEVTIAPDRTIADVPIHNGHLDPTDRERRRVIAAPAQDKPQVTSWQNFHVEAQKADVAERDRIMQEQQAIREETARTGIRSRPQYVIQQTWVEKKPDEEAGSKIISVQKEEIKLEAASEIPNMDGCSSSRLISLKRRRDVSNPDEINVSDSDEDTEKPVSVAAHTPSNLDGTTISSATDNPDAIDIDMSDDQSDSSRNVTLQKTAADPVLPAHIAASNGSNMSYDAANDQPKQAVQSLFSEASEDGGVGLNAGANLYTPMASIVSTTGHGLTSTQTNSQEAAQIHESKQTRGAESEKTFNPDVRADEQISDDLRAQLAALSSDFALQETAVEVSPALPLPEAIRNKTTKFLALGKCVKFQEFLQLMEIDANTENSGSHGQHAFKLSYDPEWLAILRVFAPELALGGQWKDPIPVHRGDTYYRDRIIEEEKWVAEHLVRPGRLDIPANFTVTAPVYNPDLQVDARDMPREVTNPQTSAFCALIDIENPFDITEQERDVRVETGPRPDRPQNSDGARGRGRRGGFNRGGGHGRDGRGGGRGGRRSRW